MLKESAFAIGAIIVALMTSAPACARTDPAAVAFQRMKELAGVWRPVDNPESSLQIRFSLTAGGTVLVEEWTRSDQPHSLTLYHRDGPDLIATHYCPQGNQPRLAMAAHSVGADIRFVLRDVTDLDAPHEAHAVEIAFDLSVSPVLLRKETYRQHDAVESSELRFVQTP